MSKINRAALNVARSNPAFARCLKTELGLEKSASRSGRFNWEAVNKKIDRLGKQMMAELSDAFAELDTYSNVDDQKAANEMKEYLEATFVEIRERVDMYEDNAYKRSRDAFKRRR